MIEFKGEDFFGSGVDLFVNKHIKELDYNDKVGRHTHDFAEIAYVYSGSGKNIAGGRSYPISRGSLILMNYGESHQIVVEETLVQIDILLSPRFISREIVSCDQFSGHSDPFGVLGAARVHRLEDTVHEPFGAGDDLRRVGVRPDSGRVRREGGRMGVGDTRVSSGCDIDHDTSPRRLDVRRAARPRGFRARYWSSLTVTTTSG